MNRFLVISATFVHGRYHGGGGQDERDHWPPSPLRLFQALVAGARTGCRALHWTEGKARAFRWLERLSPPEIAAPRAARGAAFTLFVPDNDMDKPAAAWAKRKEPHDNLKPERLRSAKSHHPWILEDGDTVRYVWKLSGAEWNDTRACAELIAHEARHLLALGRTIDVVAGHGAILGTEEVACLSGVRYRPSATSEAIFVLLAPMQGTFADLEAGHDRFLGRRRRLAEGGLDVGWRMRAFQRVAYQRVGQPPSRPYAAFRLMTLDGERWKPFSARSGFKLAAWLREAAARRLHGSANVDRAFIERCIFGHGATGVDASRRIAFLPLPSIGHGHVDGLVRRILIAEPFSGDGRLVRELAWGLPGEMLKPEDERCAVLLAAAEREGDTMIRRYVGSGRRWQTVTPVILPGYDDGGAKTGKVIKKALREAGLADFPIERIQYQREPFIPGTDHAGRYELPAYLRPYPRWHVELSFAETVRGPICIGGGRFLGVGLLSRVPAEPHKG